MIHTVHRDKRTYVNDAEMHVQSCMGRVHLHFSFKCQMMSVSERCLWMSRWSTREHDRGPILTVRIRLHVSKWWFYSCYYYYTPLHTHCTTLPSILTALHTPPYLLHYTPLHTHRTTLPSILTALHSPPYSLHYTPLHTHCTTLPSILTALHSPPYSLHYTPLHTHCTKLPSILTELHSPPYSPHYTPLSTLLRDTYLHITLYKAPNTNLVRGVPISSSAFPLKNILSSNSPSCSINTSYSRDMFLLEYCNE